VTSSWFFLSTLNYDARSTTHQIICCVHNSLPAFITLFSLYNSQHSGVISFSDSRLEDHSFSLPVNL